MKNTMLAATLSLLALASCGHSTGERALSGGAIGGGVGLVAGSLVGAPIEGAAIGAGVGAGTGALTSPKQINLNK